MISAISEPLRKARKLLTLIEIDLDDVNEPLPENVEENLTKLEGIINELRELNRQDSRTA
jgi:hypothetical protein